MPVDSARSAATKGVNAGSLDLLIATCALEYDAEIVTFDTDYQAIALACPLRVVQLSRDVA